MFLISVSFVSEILASVSHTCDVLSAIMTCTVSHICECSECNSSVKCSQKLKNNNTFAPSDSYNSDLRIHQL